jgi:hypothetical protein
MFFAMLAGLAIAAGVLYQLRFRQYRGGRVTDELIRKIERGEWIDEDERPDSDEPLDVDAIAEEEERFWEGSEWDDPDEY